MSRYLPYPGARIADIGTGTWCTLPQSGKSEAVAYMQPSIWPIDLLSQLPFNVHIDAIDISSAQFPPPAWLPDSIRVTVHDAFRPFPEHMVGTYDLVHVQTFLCIWRPDKSEILLQNLISLLSWSRLRSSINLSRCRAGTLLTHLISLEPTGYIQWTEQDVLLLRVLRAVGASVQSDSAAEQMIEWFLKPREDIDFSWIPNLDNILKSRHLESVAFDRQPVVNAHQMFHNLVFLETYIEFISNFARIAKTREEKERAAKLRNLEGQASEELLNGIGLYCELVTAVARRSVTG